MGGGRSGRAGGERGGGGGARAGGGGRGGGPGGGGGEAGESPPWATPRWEAAQVGARGTDTARERLPPCLEALGLEGCRKAVVLDLVQPPRRVEQLRRALASSAGARERRFIDDVGVEQTRCGPEPTERALTAAVIPDARGHDTASPGHARHLRQSRDRIRHEMDDELREGRVERPVREWQVLRGRTQDLDAGVALPSRSDERLGGIDGGHGHAPRRLTSSAVRAPGPQPTSSARWPSRTPARSASCGDSRREYLPMKRSYASAATSKLIGRDARWRPRRRSGCPRGRRGCAAARSRRSPAPRQVSSAAAQNAACRCRSSTRRTIEPTRIIDRW